MTKNALVIMVDRLAKVTAGIEALVGTRVMVGVPSDRAPRDAQEHAGHTINSAALAYIHENGAPEVNIPARAFMKPGIDEAMDAIMARFDAAGKAALDGRPDAVIKNYHAAGIVAVNAMRRKITDGPFVPLRPATLAARARRRRKITVMDLGSVPMSSKKHADMTGARPLIDTGQLRNALSYVLRRADSSEIAKVRR